MILNNRVINKMLAIPLIKIQKRNTQLLLISVPMNHGAFFVKYLTINMLIIYLLKHTTHLDGNGCGNFYSIIQSKIVIRYNENTCFVYFNLSAVAFSTLYDSKSIDKSTSTSEVPGFNLTYRIKTHNS